ncbi:MAG: hypothetical protein EPN91_02225 [Salinibacterium sp.]|nr:MAG: hypothetical protein EPN91_02225 [Salinibacterium sp.]
MTIDDPTSDPPALAAIRFCMQTVSQGIIDAMDKFRSQGRPMYQMEREHLMRLTDELADLHDREKAFLDNNPNFPLLRDTMVVFRVSTANRKDTRFSLRLPLSKLLTTDPVAERFNSTADGPYKTLEQAILDDEVTYQVFWYNDPAYKLSDYPEVSG